MAQTNIFCYWAKLLKGSLAFFAYFGKLRANCREEGGQAMAVYGLAGVAVLVLLVNLPIVLTTETSVDREQGVLRMQGQYLFFRRKKTWQWSWKMPSEKKKTPPKAMTYVWTADKSYLKSVGWQFLSGVHWQQVSIFGNIPLIIYPWMSIIYGVGCVIAATLAAKVKHRLPLQMAIAPTSEKGLVYCHGIVSVTPAHLLWTAVRLLGVLLRQWGKQVLRNKRRSANYHEQSAYQ